MHLSNSDELGVQLRAGADFRSQVAGKPSRAVLNRFGTSSFWVQPEDGTPVAHSSHNYYDYCKPAAGEPSQNLSSHFRSDRALYHLLLR